MRTALFVLILALAGCGRKPEEAAKPVVAVEVERVDKTTAPVVVRAAVTDARVMLERLRNGTLPGDVERARAQVPEQEAGAVKWGRGASTRWARREE